MQSSAHKYETILRMNRLCFVFIEQPSYKSSLAIGYFSQWKPASIYLYLLREIVIQAEEVD